LSPLVAEFKRRACARRHLQATAASISRAGRRARGSASTRQAGPLARHRPHVIPWCPV